MQYYTARHELCSQFLRVNKPGRKPYSQPFNEPKYKPYIPDLWTCGTPRVLSSFSLATGRGSAPEKNGVVLKPGELLWAKKTS